MDIVFFTMEGREWLLHRTLKSLPAEIREAAERIIVACDGAADMAVLAEAKPDLILIAPRRRGYIRSIADVLNLVRSDLFLWIEDDWNLDRLQRSDLDAMSEALKANDQMIQVRWSKTAPLLPSSRKLDGAIFESDVGFSANPNVSKTLLVREGFASMNDLRSVGRELGVDGFENVLTRWAASQGYICGVIDPGREPAIEHEGDLESTGREWHMTASIKEKPQAYGYLGHRPPFWRRLWMIAKLANAIAVLACVQLFSDAHYDLAFRVVSARRKFGR